MKRFFCTWSAIFLSACGLIDSSEPLLPFPSDGVGAFQDAAPVEVCLGTARVIAPALATGATALCAPTDQTARTCSTKGDCTGLEKCICGRCIVEPCQGGAACSGNEVCRGKRCTQGCGSDGDCASNERCISGGCARTCKGHRDCHYGERCDSLDDVCVVSLCGSGGTCGAGAECIAVAEVGELHEPAYLGDEPVAFVELNRNGEHTVHRARIISTQVWHIEPIEPVLQIAGETLIGAPSVIRRDSGIDMYAAVGNPSRIVRAHSSDEGSTFVVDLDPVLVAQEAWEQGSVGSPSVVDFKGSTYLLYEGGARAGIGLAQVDAQGAQRAQPNPILSAENVQDPIFWRNVTTVGAPQAIVAGESVRIVFTARGIEGFSATSGAMSLPPEANDSLGLATTDDMQTFALFPAGPIFARVVNLRAYLGEAEANMRVLPSGAEMVFVSSDASGEAKTGLVRVVGRGGGN